MAADELTKALLLEEVAPPRAIADALFASVNGGVPLLQALVDAGAASPDVLMRYLARSETPFLRQVIPLAELIERLPLGLCVRLLALPVRRDAITGTVDVVVADPADPHPASEIAFHLNAPVRVVRAPIGAIEEALRRWRMLAKPHAPHAPQPQYPPGVTPNPAAVARFNEAALAAAQEDERLFDSRPRGSNLPAPPGAFGRPYAHHMQPTPNPQRVLANAGWPHEAKHPSLPPAAPELSYAIPFAHDVPPRRGGLVIETDDSAPPPPMPKTRMRTPPWGTPIHMIDGAPAPMPWSPTPDTTAANATTPGTSPPQSGYGSEIPIPLTRRTMAPAPPPGRVPQPGYALPALPSFLDDPPPAPPPSRAPPISVPAPRQLHPQSQSHSQSQSYSPAPSRSPFGGGTQRPPAMIDPTASPLGEGYVFDTTGFRDVVEKSAPPRVAAGGHASVAMPPMGQPIGFGDSSHLRSASPIGSFIPGPPPLPGMGAASASVDRSAPALPFPEMSGILAALRNAGSRDEVLELVLTGARMVALKVALFVVKKGGYLGWVGTPEFADRGALQSVLIPIDAPSIFDRAVREDLYLGPIRYDEVHAPLLRVIRNPSRDVAAVPIRVSGKTAVIIVADELGDTMIGTRRLEELARAAGEAFARIVRTRR